MSNFFKSRRDLHLQRKLFHFLTILTITYLMVVLEPKQCWMLYWFVGFPIFLMDLLRTYSHRWNKFCLKVIGPVIRAQEVSKLSGSSWAFVGIGITYFIFPPLIAQLATLFLAVGDPIASFFGVLYGKFKILGQKSLIGTIAAFVACFICALIFFNAVHPTDLTLGQKFVLISLAAAIGALTELIPLGRLDDNLTQPLMSGVLLFLLMGVFQ